MRCPDCNKFVGMDPQDPEVYLGVGGPDEDGNAQVTGEVRCVLACAECGTELKETTFEIDEEVKVGTSEAGHPGSKHELDIEETNSEATETGGSRYQRNERGFTLDWEITCNVEHCDLKVAGSFEQSLAASAWDEV